MYQNLKGLIIRSVDYRDADKILTVLTDRLGKITVKARGVRKKGNRFGGTGQLFAYSHMTLYERQDRYILHEAEPVELFTGLQGRLEAVALASYLAELLGTEAEASPAQPDVLRLALNGLYALANSLYPDPQIKAAFELRYMSLSGYHPMLETCGVCGCPEPPAGWLLPLAGMLVCRECAGGDTGFFLDEGALAAARYILTAPVNRIFSFTLQPPSQRLLYDMCEEYLLQCMERDFKTLSFYRGVAML